MRPDLLLVGLGNPGRKYRKNRHNAGFIVCDSISDADGLKFRFGPGNSRILDWTFEEKEVIVAKPMTFMNNSGKAISELLSFYSVGPERLLVICDDFSLPLGTIRIRKSGSAGGHNGLQSIIDQLKTVHFPRMRIGIAGKEEVSDWVEFVLKNFKRKELKIVLELSREAQAAVKTMILDGIDQAMTKYNKNYAVQEAQPKEV